MSAPFQRSLRALRADNAHRLSVMLAVAMPLAAAWGFWFVRVPVQVYAVSRSARIEVEQAAHPVQSGVSGRVVATALQLGRTVQQAEPLVELDAQSFKLELSERRARLDGLAPQIDAIERQIRAKVAGLEQQRRVSIAQSAEAQAREREAEMLARFNEAEAQRGDSLREVGALSSADLERRRSSSDATRAAVDAQHSAAARGVAEKLALERALEAEVAELERTRRELASEERVLESTIASLLHQIEIRTIRAPIYGQLGEVAALQPGAVLREGALVAAVVPQRRLRVVAEFDPATALGRVRPLQTARLRLAGFPWAQYGSVPLSVTNVGTELRDGHVRVELAIVHGPESGLILQHGLPGEVEVRVERATPLVLALRAAGRLISQQAPAELFTRAAP